MALRFVFDRVEGSRVRNTIHGVEIVRRVTVFDLPVESLATSHKALLRIIADIQCPRLRTAHPDPATGAELEEHQLVSIEEGKRRVEMDLVYRGGFNEEGGGGGIIWTMEDAPVVSHVLTNQTADLTRALNVWYKSGEPDTTQTTNNGGTLVSGADIKGIQAHKAVVDRTLRVTGRTTRAQWAAYRQSIQGMAGTINNATWGGYPRGEWLFLGPHTRTIDRGNTFDAVLEFWWKRGGHYAIGWYIDEQGRIPKDVAKEASVRLGGPPPVGHYKGANGVMMGSVQGEANFSSVFNFTPDDPP